MNEGIVDRIIRIIVGAVLLIIASVVLDGGAQIALWVISAILLLTGATGYCLLYLPFRFSTKR